MMLRHEKICTQHAYIEVLLIKVVESYIVIESMAALDGKSKYADTDIYYDITEANQRFDHIVNS